MSDLFQLVKSDYIKGGIMFVLSAVITTLVQMLQNGFDIDYKQILLVASISALTYIGKQLGTEVRPSGEFIVGRYKI